MDSASELVQLVFKFCEVFKATVDDMGDNGLFPYRSTQGAGHPPLRALHLANWGGGLHRFQGPLTSSRSVGTRPLLASSTAAS